MSDLEVVNLFGETMAEPWHGTLHSYNKKKCRCSACKEKHNSYKRELRSRLQKQIRGNEPWHGTERGYTDYMCRCTDCTKAHADHQKAKRLSHSESDRHRILVKRIVNNYSVPFERVESLLLNPRCKICGTKHPGLTKSGTPSWCVDHDHSCCPGTKSCGKCVREVLCNLCNSLIGFAKDDPEILKSAIAYLELHAA